MLFLLLIKMLRNQKRIPHLKPRPKYKTPFIFDDDNEPAEESGSTFNLVQRATGRILYDASMTFASTVLTEK